MEEYAFLQQFCKEKHIKSVLEFGPGTSTLAFLDAGCDVVSIEENWKWFQVAQRTLMLPNCTLLLGAPPAIMDHPRIAASSFDLAFVDGPGAKGPLPRLHSMQAAMSRASIVILHDANRAGEQATITEVTKNGGWEVIKQKSRRGIGILLRQSGAAVVHGERPSL